MQERQILKSQIIKFDRSATYKLPEPKHHHYWNMNPHQMISESWTRSNEECHKVSYNLISMIVLCLFKEKSVASCKT
jgi:hypothetical protein